MTSRFTMSADDALALSAALKAVIDLIDRGEMIASTAMRYRIEGAVVAASVLVTDADAVDGIPDATALLAMIDTI